MRLVPPPADLGFAVGREPVAPMARLLDRDLDTVRHDQRVADVLAEIDRFQNPAHDTIFAGISLPAIAPSQRA